MSDGATTISICLTVAVLFGTLVGGVASCTVLTTQEQTKCVQSACGGDLQADAARSSACTLALVKTGHAGR